MEIKEKENESKDIKNQKTEYYIYSWGFSKYGQTGLENCQYTDEPNKLLIPITKEIKSISCGEYNTSIIFPDNKTYIYGLNTFGQLGNGSKRNKSRKISIIPLLSPIKFKQISLGGGHCLALSLEGKLYSWGLNIFGQLGLGHNNNISHPTLVEKIASYESLQEYDTSNNLKEINLNYDKNIILDIKAGPQHSVILFGDNCLYSCGFGKFGALGYYLDNDDPSENNIFTKIEIEKNFENNKLGKINIISAGLYHSGFICDNKCIYIIGGEKNFKINGFHKFEMDEILEKNNIEKNNDNNIIIDFQIGKNCFVILTKSGLVFTEGDNSLGQLGRINTETNDNNNENNNNKDPDLFKKVDLPEKIINISVGYEFTYAISESKKIYAWGSNKFGQIPEYGKNICDQPFFLQKITNLNPLLISCGGYHVSSLCNIEYNLNDTVKYFKNVPLNKCFNFDDFQKKEIFYDRLSETVDNQQQKLDSVDLLEKDYNKKLKDLEKKENKIKNKEKGTEINSISLQDDLENIEIEKVLEEEIEFKELDFPEDALIGSGACGEVKKAFWRKTLVSVKFLKLESDKPDKKLTTFIEEYNLLKQLRHPNILLYLGGNITTSPYFLVTEFCENGNLFQFLHGKDAPDLEDFERLNLALEIAQGINYLHSFNPPILHRDLKSLNVLLDKNYVAKIADFGLARLRDNHMTRLRGTFQWMAPEVIVNENYSEKADVYSFGIILWEFWSKDPPYKGIKAKEVAIKVKNNKNYRPKIPEEVPQEIAELMKACWDEDPNKRPGFIDIINYIDEYLKSL